MSQDLRTNHSAESILNVLISLALAFSIIISIALLIGGIVIIKEEPGIGDDPDIDILIGICLIVAAIVNTVIALISWAGVKIWINVSRNLFNINRKVDLIEEDVELIRMNQQD